MTVFNLCICVHVYFSTCIVYKCTFFIPSYRTLGELLEKFASDVKSRGVPKPGADGSGVVIPSAADLFVFYKKCLVQCSSLSTGPALLELTQLFRKYLKEYSSRILSPNIPK